MRNLSDYPKTLPSSDTLPYGMLKNESIPGARDGTDIQAEQLQDLYYPLYQVLGLAGVTPSGELENARDNKQFLNSLANISWLKYDSQLSYQKNAVVLHTVNDVTTAYRSIAEHNTLALDNLQGWRALFSIDAEHNLHIQGREGTGAGLPIGSIISMARQDIPEGYVRCDGAIYPVAAYPDFVVGYLESGKIPAKPMAEYLAELAATNGACGFFGYDAGDVNFRVPTLPHLIYLNQFNSADSDQYIAQIQAAQLPNIVGTASMNSNTGIEGKAITSGAFFKTTNKRQYYVSGSAQVNNPVDLGFDASRVNGCYKNIATEDLNPVLTRAIHYPYLICLANIAVPASAVQYDAFVQGLNHKADSDGHNLILDRLTAQAFQNLLRRVQPCAKAKRLLLSSVSFPYTPPDYGILYVDTHGAGDILQIQSRKTGMNYLNTGAHGNSTIVVPVEPNDTYDGIILPWSAATEGAFYFYDYNNL